MKRGRMSKVDMQYIRDNAHFKNYVDIAEELDREPVAIKNYIETKLNLTVNLSTKGGPVDLVNTKLKDKNIWLTLVQQFSEEELDHIEYEWGQINEQFKGDILPLEELQVVDAIRMGVLMNRDLIQQRKNSTMIEEYELEITKAKKEIPLDIAQVANMELQLITVRTSQEVLGKDYRDLQDKKNNIIKLIKGTREQRVKRVESSKESFTQWMTQIVNDQDTRRNLSIRMEKMRLSMIDEEVRLSAYHKYEDGGIDQPFLTPQTVKDDNANVYANQE